MPEYIQGQTAYDYFSALDGTLTPLLGVTWVTTSTIDPDGDVFPLLVTEMGNGVYRVSFEASKIGSYYYRIDSTVISPAQSYEELITIIPPEIYGSTQGPAAYGNTLDDLFRAVATEVGDFKEVEATAPGTTADFPDSKRLATIPAKSLQGAALYIYRPVLSLNYGEDTRIADSSPTGKTLTL